jgi:serine/threonine protein kinase
MMAIHSTLLCPGCFADKGRETYCPRCGYDESAERGPLALPHRTLLQGQYLVGRVLGKPGGFGITYLAFDTGLETRVAIKEYLPRDLAGRDGGRSTVKAHSREDGELFRFGLEEFIGEARTLAKFDHLHLVRVRHVFEENGTAYMVMDYYEGLTLAEYLHRKGRVAEKTALDILMPILDGLREVHEKGFIHRDIKPQNIYLTNQGRPILLDFGAARLAMAERSRSLSVVLTPGYAPFEQYQRRGEQGPWTDVYACAAVLYQMVTGEAPPEATERVDEDGLQPPRALAPDLSQEVAKTLMKGLAMTVRDRYKSIYELQDALFKPKVEDDASHKISECAEMEAEAKHEPHLHVNAPSLKENKDYPCEDSDASEYKEEPNSSKLSPQQKIRLSIAWVILWLGFGFLIANSIDSRKMEPLPSGQSASPIMPQLSPLEELSNMAESGDPEAQFNLALKYNNGEGVGRDYKKAIKWYRKAAEQGNVEAQNNLGIMYDSGMGVKRNFKKAAYWFQKSAEKGNTLAQRNLGLMYENGQGVKSSAAEAVKWYRKSAEGGDSDGQYFLGNMYLWGKGVGQSAEQAAYWYRKSAEQDHEDARKALAKLK